MSKFQHCAKRPAHGFGVAGSSKRSPVFGPHLISITLSGTNQTPTAAPSFLSCDQVLASAVNLAYTHKTKQRRIEWLDNEILELDRKWREICTELAEEKQSWRI